MTFLNALQKQLKTLSFLLTLIHSQNLYAHQTIAITQIVDHPSLNAIRDGILEELAENGYKEGDNISIISENAQGNATIAAQIAQKFAGMSLDVIVPISTPSAQTVVQQIKTTPVIFAAISDPLAAKVVSSLEHPGSNVTGVADIPPIKEQLEFIMGCLPNLKTLGVVYNPGEANNVSFLDALQAEAEAKGISVIPAAAPKSSDVKSAALKLVNQIDAFFIGNDNTVVSGLEALIKICLDANKPLFTSDPESVTRGALAAYAYDQKEIGRQVGQIVVNVLKGQNPGDISVEKPKELKMSINEKSAKKMNFKCDIKNHVLEEK